jgi:hypothetical protein
MNKSAKVHELMMDCIGGKIVVQGIVRSFGFDEAKITEHKEEIRALLQEMPDEFQHSKGGGMSFLNLCLDKNGEQWAEQSTMEALVALGVAAGMASFPLPRDMWSILPGGVPYVTFNTEITDHARL